MNAERSAAWAWATVAVAASLALGLSWCIGRSPLTLYDGLGPILDSVRSPGLRNTFESAWHSSGYWRPLRLAAIKAVVDVSAGDPTFAFKAIHVALTCAFYLLFAAWIRPRSASEFTAGAIALMILAGHHSFFILFGEAYPINHFLEIAALSLAVALMARGQSRWWKDLLAAAILAWGALTIESGLLIGIVAITCWLVGWRGISGRGILLIVALLATYFWMRFVVLQIASPGLYERTSGWWLTRLQPDELVSRFSADPLPFYAYNVLASFLDVLLSEPQGGVWSFVQQCLDDEVHPWMVIQIASSVLATAALSVALIPALTRWRRGALVERDRFVLVAFAVLGANSAVSFGYVKDEVLSVAATFYAGGVFAALATIGDRMRTDWAGARRAGAALLLAATSVLWSTRAVATFFSLESVAYKTTNDWASYSLQRELPADWDYEPTRRTFLELRKRNVEFDVPYPTFTPQRRVDRYLEVR